MLQSIDKKYKYFFFGFLFILLSTVNNTNVINSFNFTPKVKNIEVFGLKRDINEEIKYKLEFLKHKNIYNIDKKKIINILNKYSFIDKYKVSKIYPSKIIIHLTETDYLAKTMVNNVKYVVGSNGKLIDVKYAQDKIQLPNIFGNFSGKSFINLIKQINNTNFNYNEVNNFYYFPSKRWDIEMKSNLVIKLPKDDLENSFNKLNKILTNSKLNNSKIIDLRVPGQLIILDE